MSEQSFERALPHSSESERAILGAIILDNGLIHSARTEVIPEQFYVPSHRRIFQAMIAVSDRNEEINPILIGEELKQENALETVGGVSFITNLTYGLPHSTNIRNYAKVIRGKAALRDLIKLASKITNEALEEEDDPETIVSKAEQSLFDLALQTRTDSKSSTRTYDQVGSSVVQMFERWSEGKVISVPTRIPELDHKLAYGGFSAGDLIVIAARTSFGKSALALQIALNAGRAGTPVLFFSLEMSAEKLFIRNLSSVADVPHNQIKPWTFEHDRTTAAKILQAVGRLTSLPLQVEDRVNGLQKLCAIARDWHRRVAAARGGGLIIADYLQLVGNKMDKRSREQEVAGISTAFKHLATELNVPVIGISQFSREQAKANRRPELSDLRESGQIENDCDVVLFPYSLLPLEDTPNRPMQLYCPKQRSGKVGWEIQVDFDADHQWFHTEETYRDAGRVA